MKLLFFCPWWGSQDIPFDDFFDRVVASGYDGVEAVLPEAPEERKTFLKSLKAHDLQLIVLYVEFKNYTREERVSFMNSELRELATYQPLFINAQTGKDYESFKVNEELITLCQKISEQTKVKILHETHRGKFNFAAHICREYVDKLPNLRLTLDISHWYNVSESYLEGQHDTMNAIMERVDHMHARVGYPEGPQVSDPRIPAWQEAVSHHLVWWDKLLMKKLEEGNDIFTITPEFGPYPYMVHLPHSNEPIADQWEVNVYMKDYLKSRFQQKIDDFLIKTSE